MVNFSILWNWSLSEDLCIMADVCDPEEWEGLLLGTLYLFYKFLECKLYSLFCPSTEVWKNVKITLRNEP